jgi:hypothetical protein
LLNSAPLDEDLDSELLHLGSVGDSRPPSGR